MKHILPPLPYAYDALEPFIDARTMELHHSKHHATYVAKLNEALEKHEKLSDIPLGKLLTSLDTIPEDIRMAVRNHGGGHYNHSLFWNMICPAKAQGNEPAGVLKIALEAQFGSIKTFMEEFQKTALGVFGSGWAWLALTNNQQLTTDNTNKLQIIKTSNQDTPLELGFKPLLGLDVWEHAYYLQYQNRRQEYVEAFWNVINWEEVEKRFSNKNK